MVDDVIKAQKGDKKALENIILENLNSLYIIAYTITRNEEDSKDAISSTVLKVCEKIQTLKNPEYFKTWITKILINQCNNLMKKNKKTTSLNELENLQGHEDNIAEFAMMETINKLNKNFKEIIILYYYNDFSVKEISQILKIEQGTVKSRLARAREELKKYNIEKMEV